MGREDVLALYRACLTLKHKAMLLTLYSTGIRANELAHLKVADIDSERMVIRIDSGKGGKDRYVPLSEKLLKLLRAYWRQQRPRPWLFPADRRGTLMSRNGVSKMIHALVCQASH
jgi:integrase/recombinase XerD